MNKIKLFHIITLSLGDWSDDGHGKTKTFNIKCNLSLKNLKKAYLVGAKKLKVDIVNDIAADYEDAKIDDEQFEIFQSAGFIVDKSWFPYSLNEPDDFYLPKNDDQTFGLCVEIFAQLYLFTCKIGDPNLQYELVKRNENIIDIGGYGLFY